MTSYATEHELILNPVTTFVETAFEQDSLESSDYTTKYMAFLNMFSKKVRWSINSKQGARYIKTRMGNDLRQKILVQNGIISKQQIEKNHQFLIVHAVV
jgi:hypothetical protein